MLNSSAGSVVSEVRRQFDATWTCFDALSAVYVYRVRLMRQTHAELLTIFMLGRTSVVIGCKIAHCHMLSHVLIEQTLKTDNQRMILTFPCENDARLGSSVRNFHVVSLPCYAAFLLSSLVLIII
jgi:hypothetical protein